MKQTLISVYKRVGLFSLAFVLAVSTLTAAVPFILSQEVGAVAGTGYTTVDPAAGWTVDRTTPSGGYGSESFDGRQTLSIGVDAPSDAPSTFYQYEGIAKTVANGTQTLKADLYIDPTWPENVRAGFWGVGHETSGAISSYPILEYNTATSSTNWRIWDSNPGGWRDIDVTSATIGWNTIELAINKLDSTKTDVYVNDSLVGTSATEPTVDFRRIILNNYNFGTNDYAVRWSNIEAGRYAPETPQNIRINRGSAVIASGTTVGPSFITGNVALNFDAVSGAKYITEIIYPGGTKQVSNNFNNTWLVKNNVPAQGEFSIYGDGSYTYRVKALNTTTGLSSEWSSPVTLNFDSTGPTNTVNANGVELPENTASSSAVLIPGANPTTFQATLSDEGSAPQGAYIELFKANWDGSYGNWVKDNTNGAGNVRYGASPKLVFNTSALSGKYGLKIVSSDATGNSNTSYHFFTIDNNIPSVTIKSTSTSMVDGSSASNPFTYISFKLHDVNGNLKEVDVNGNLYNRTGTWADLNWSNINPAHILQGQNTVTVRDTAGNSSTITFDFDTAAPEVILNSLPTVVRGTVTVTGSVSDNVRFGHYNLSLYKDGVDLSDGAPHSSDREAVAGGWTTGGQTNVSGAAASISRSLDTTLLDDGVYQIRLAARDAAGNLDTANSVKYFSFTVDNTAPEVEILNYTTFGNVITPEVDAGAGIPEWTQTSGDLDGVEISDANVLEPDFTVLQDGTYEFDLTVTDAVGNVTTRTFSFTYTSFVDNSGEEVEGTNTTADGANGTGPQTTAVAATPTIVGPGFTNVAVLGESTDESATAEDVAGATTEDTLAQAVNSDENNGRWMGLAWYWWIVIIAGLAALAWWIIAAARNRREDS